MIAARFLNQVSKFFVAATLSALVSTAWAMPSCLTGTAPAAPSDTKGVTVTYAGQGTITTFFWFEPCPATADYPYNGILLADIILDMGASISFNQITDPFAFRQNGVAVNGAWVYNIIGTLAGGTGRLRARISKGTINTVTQYFDPTAPVDLINRVTQQVGLVIPAQAGNVPAVPANINPTDLWWNPNESGWGINVNQQGNTIFATMFTYDLDKKGMWLVLSSGARVGTSNKFTGDLYRTTGSAFNAQPFVPVPPANVTKVGTMTIDFLSTNIASVTFSVNGVTIVESVQPQLFATQKTVCTSETAVNRATASNYTDLWWNPLESGWGINFAHQGNVIFGTLFTYDTDNKGMWLVMSAGSKQVDGSFKGELYRTTGTPFNAPVVGGTVTASVTPVGTMTVRFINGENATLTYTVNGVTVTKLIQRQVFGTSVPVCVAG
jgi:hypothetical protein